MPHFGQTSFAFSDMAGSFKRGHGSTTVFLWLFGGFEDDGTPAKDATAIGFMHDEQPVFVTKARTQLLAVVHRSNV
jgi:hypothetical protein